jgi:hypothetical protein
VGGDVDDGGGSVVGGGGVVVAGGGFVVGGPLRVGGVERLVVVVVRPTVVPGPEVVEGPLEVVAPGSVVVVDDEEVGSASTRMSRGLPTELGNPAMATPIPAHAARRTTTPARLAAGPCKSILTP